MDLLEHWNSRRKNIFLKAADIDDQFFLKSFIIIVNEDYYYEHIRFVVNYNEFLGLSHYSPTWKYSPPLWYIYHDWGAVGYLTTKLGGGGYNGNDPNFFYAPSFLNKLFLVKNPNSTRISSVTDGGFSTVSV